MAAKPARSNLYSGLRVGARNWEHCVLYMQGESRLIVPLKKFKMQSLEREPSNIYFLYFSSFRGAIYSLELLLIVIVQVDGSNVSVYEDRTSRFFPPQPRPPKMPGLVPGDSGFTDDSEDSFQELSNSSSRRFNILCSGDKDGNICFSIFGIFPIGKINIHSVSLFQLHHSHLNCRLLSASIHKVALSKDLCNLVVLCSGEVVEHGIESNGLLGFHSLVLDTSIFWNRKKELYQVALQASSIEDLTEVIQTSFSVMSKQWNDAMRTFHEKFNSLSTLIANHGLDSTPEEEFISLLCGARISPPLHQFLVQSIGEAGLKRLTKLVCGAAKDLQQILLDHVQPAAEIIVFRMGELRGLSRWRARYHNIGLDEILIENATEKAGMLLVQIQRCMIILSSVTQQFSNFFSWLLKSTRTLLSEPSDQLLPFSSELVIVFLKFLYDQDPIKQLLESSEIECNIGVDLETAERVKELVQFGGFSDTEYLRRTLAEEFLQMVSSLKEAFDMPFSTMSKKILCKDLIPLFPLESSQKDGPSNIAVSISFYKDSADDCLNHEECQERMTGYMLFKIPDKSFPNISNCIGIARGFVRGFGSSENEEISLEAALFSVPDGYNCVDLSLYKEGQIILLLNETASISESTGSSCLMLVQACDLPFVSLPSSSNLSSWKLDELVDSVMCLNSENERVRGILHSAVAPLAVSASRGVACVFAARKRALVYILEEDEDEMSDSE
ncbi:OLC1v1021715C1 [Oldenlandia corymbosa var. corymbosa]|uniref:Anaphase-promoting complex subunit 4 n=1 Tax=Oldenlandia corymbosa var. corymbosa TaxID=529605 RepID=A0AAV1BWW5_OLDCO|nr:OLC1v1021715C1 [Oldenlandia corymbosa var. corymbosa]